MSIKCSACKTSFDARRGAKTCSPRCRKRLQRLKHSLTRIETPTPATENTAFTDKKKSKEYLSYTNEAGQYIDNDPIRAMSKSFKKRLLLTADAVEASETGSIAIDEPIESLFKSSKKHKLTFKKSYRKHKSTEEKTYKQWQWAWAPAVLLLVIGGFLIFRQLNSKFSKLASQQQSSAASANTMTDDLKSELAQLNNNAVKLQINTDNPQTGNIAITGDVRAANIRGQNLDTNNLQADAFIGNSVAANSFTGGNFFGPNFFGGDFSGTNFTGDNFYGGNFTGDGTNLSNLNASNILSGTLSNSRLTSNVTLQGNTFNGASQLVKLTATGILPTLDGSQLTNISASGCSSCVQLQGTTPGTAQTGNLNISGTAIAGNYLGNGSALTALNGSNIASGTVADGRLSSTVTLQGNTFNGISQLVQLTGAGLLPVLNGSNLTNLSVANCAGCVQLQGSTPGAAQTGHLNITGTAIAGTVQGTTSVLTSALDTTAAGALTFGNTNATSVSICNSAACNTLSLATNADADAVNIGDALDTLTITGAAASTIVLNGTTITAAELNLLDGHDVALVDTNDAVATAITGTGALNAGSITNGFGSIDTGADNITTTGTVSGNDFDRTAAGALTFGNTNATSVSICNSAACNTLSLATNADADAVNIGDALDTLTITGAAASTIVLNGTTITAAELNLLDGHDVALVDTNDAVATAIIGTGALNAGSIANGFGSIDTGADNITTTGTLQGTTSVLTSLLDTVAAGVLNIGTTNATSIGLNQNTTVLAGKSFTANGTALFKNSADSATAFQVQDAAGGKALTVNTTVGTVGVGGTGAATDAVFYSLSNNFTTIRGNVTGAGDVLQLQKSGTNTFTVGSTGAVLSKNSADSTTAFQIQNAAANPYLLVNTSGASISVGDAGIASTVQIGNTTGAVAQTINLGNNATAASTNTITIGSTVGTSALTLQGGTGGVVLQSQGGTLGIGNNSVAQTLTIGNATGTTAASVLCGTGTCGFGNNATDHSTTVGSITGTSLTTLQSGSGGVTVNATAAAVTIQSTTSGAINLKPAGSDNVVIGTSDTTGTLLVLDDKTGSGDPTGAAGGMYYNSNSAKFRCYENSVWQNCILGNRTGGTWTRASQAVGAGIVDVSWDTEVADTNGFLTPTSTTATIPSGLGGLYSFSLIVVGIGNNGTSNGAIGCTAGGYTYNADTTAFGDGSVSAVVPLAAGDTIVCHVYSGGTTITGNRLNIYRVGN